MTSGEAWSGFAELFVGDLAVVFVRALVWWVKRRAELRRRAIAPLA